MAWIDTRDAPSISRISEICEISPLHPDRSEDARNR